MDRGASGARRFTSRPRRSISRLCNPPYSCASGTPGTPHPIAGGLERNPSRISSTPLARISAVKLLVQRAHKHHSPEALHCAGRLFLRRPQPFQHRNAARFLKILWLPFAAQNNPSSRGPMGIICPPNVSWRESRKRPEHVERCGKQPGLHFTGAPLTDPGTTVDRRI